VATAPASARTRQRKLDSPFLGEIGDLMWFSAAALRALPRSLRYSSEALRINAVITRRTTLLLFVMCAFVGLSASNFGFFFLRSIGASDFAGIVPGLVTPRQIAPQMFGYVFAGSIGCGIAAELGSARIQQELDAYNSEGVDPMEILVGTRLLAVLLWVPLATAISVAGCLAGSYFLVVIVLGGNSDSQLIDTYFSIFPSSSLLYCAITIAVITLQCSLVACFYGTRDMGSGPAAVGTVVARSLAFNLVAVHFTLALAGLVFYGGSLGIPIGD
jgi:phospholipid/cholesterol/gamma-HCH transport system permease protein